MDRHIYTDPKWPDDVALLATIYHDWTVMQLENGDAFAFNRSTGAVYKLPSRECPFVIWPRFTSVVGNP